MPEHCVKVTPDNPWPARIAFVAAAGFVVWLAPFVVQGFLDALVPSYLHAVGPILSYFLGAYIVVAVKRHWPPGHWCYSIEEHDEVVILHDLHHPGIVGRGDTVEAAAADARRRYFRTRFL